MSARESRPDVHELLASALMCETTGSNPKAVPSRDHRRRDLSFYHLVLHFLSHEKRMTKSPTIQLANDRRAATWQCAAACIAPVSDTRDSRAFDMERHGASRPRTNTTIRAAGSAVGGRTP